MPMALLLFTPFIKRSTVTQPESIQERATHQGKGMLILRHQNSLLCLGHGQGVLLHLLIDLLHRSQIELQRSLGVETEEIVFMEKIALLPSSAFSIDEEPAERPECSA